ncbi:hypothetical protein K435DRAFT_773378 [Dendrothele bispora CBS 962.96]|uniref:DUF6533 domain-containing protein n=1 Tax=Dendrothele bispora (strain CBS 962.96) TaxID=1314807 RepID=A0A4S8MTE2_DENBC|nr:hypothetical protein K435DRAFT_773378 [Dendrothele bispora CBS 962.96]
MQSAERAEWIIILTNISSAAFLVYDTLLTLDDEVNYIWNNFRQSWIKWHFVLVRYWSLSYILIRLGVQMAIVSGNIKSLSIMKAWLLSQTVIGNLLIITVQIILMVRVYALYDKNRYIAWMFSLLAVSECVTTVLNVIFTTHRDLTLSNVLGPAPRSFVYFGIIPSLTQLTILVLTLLQYRRAARGGWAKTPIIGLMIRDGTIAFIVLFAMTAGWVITTVMSSRYTPVFYSWLICFGASTACRIIINTYQIGPAPRLPTRSTRDLTFFSTENEPETCTTLNYS